MPGTNRVSAPTVRRERANGSTGRARGLEKYSRGQIRLAAALDEIEGDVEVDLGMLGKLDGHQRLVPGLQQLARAPGRDAIDSASKTSSVSAAFVLIGTTIGSTSLG